MDMRLLKKLVFNSIEYSALNDQDREDCLELLQSKWDSFVQSRSQVATTEEEHQAASQRHLLHLCY